MKRSAAFPVFLLACLLTLGFSIARADFDGRVVAVTDGDTIRVLDRHGVQHKIRLTGIDAPERSQPFGGASRRNLATLVAGQDVRIETNRNDRYGRVLGKVRVRPPDCPDCDRTLDANLAQIVAGMAWWYEYYASEQPPADREQYKNAVGEARRDKRGLWRESDAVPPWAWRRGTRSIDANPPAGRFRCGQKRYCREMGSCEEAKFHLRECGLSSLDGNGDGLPCASICR